MQGLSAGKRKGAQKQRWGRTNIRRASSSTSDFFWLGGRGGSVSSGIMRGLDLGGSMEARSASNGARNGFLLTGRELRFGVLRGLGDSGLWARLRNGLLLESGAFRLRERAGDWRRSGGF